MFLQRFANITAEFPLERDALARLGELIGTGVQRRLTLDHIFLRVRPHSEVDFVRLLERLVAMGAIERVYQVESPATRAPLEEFSSYDRIPESIFDVSSEMEIPVTPRNVRPLYLVQ